MKKRSEELVELRPSIFLEEESSKPLEKFQNQVLRPILKYQQELWILEVKQTLFFVQIKSKRLKSFWTTIDMDRSESTYQASFVAPTDSWTQMK